MLLGIFRISGHSMLPSLKPNDRVLISSIPYLFSKPKIGDIIIFEYGNKNLVKRIKKIKDSDYYVSGDNKSDTLKVESINKKDILGKVVAKSYS